MKASELLTTTLKRTLKAQGMTYAALAGRLGVSEATVKRMFARGKFDLQRLDQVVAAIGCDLHELLRMIPRDDRLLESLTWEQEAEIVRDPCLFTVAVCTLHLLSADEIRGIYRISAAECVRCLLRLDRIGFLSVLANDTYRLRIARTFRWLPDGPILRCFRAQAEEFLDHDFAGPGECVGVVNVRLSNEHRLALLERTRQLAREYSDMHNQDASMPLARRHPMSLLIAVRSWEPRFMRSLRRLDDASLAQWLKSTAGGSPSRPTPRQHRPQGTTTPTDT